MQNFLTPRFILTFIFIGVVSAAISALLFSPQIGFLNWITGFFSAMTALRFFGVTVVVLAAAGISYAAARIGTDPIALGLVPVGSGYTYGRRLSTNASTGETKLVSRTADDALDDIDSMVGLGPRQIRNQQIACQPRSRTPAAGTKSVGRRDQPAYGFHRSAGRRKNRHRAGTRRYLSLARRASQRPFDRGRQEPACRRLCRSNRDEDARRMSIGARWRSGQR